MDFVVNADLRRLFEENHLNLDELQRLTAEVQRWGVKLDTETVGFVITRKMNNLMAGFVAHPHDIGRLRYISDIFRLLKPLPLQLNTWMVQNLYFYIGRELFADMQAAIPHNEVNAQRWVKHFTELGEELEVKIA